MCRAGRTSSRTTTAESGRSRSISARCRPRWSSARPEARHGRRSGSGPGRGVARASRTAWTGPWASPPIPSSRRAEPGPRTMSSRSRSRSARLRSTPRWRSGSRATGSFSTPSTTSPSAPRSYRSWSGRRLANRPARGEVEPMDESRRPIIDISPPLTPDLGVWPGDVPLEREPALDLERGDPVTLSAMRATVHLGAHADAPSHTRRGSPSIGECDLLPYIGPCQVIRIAARRGSRIGRKELPAAIDAPRVLLATGTFPDPLRWNEDFAAPGPDLIEDLHARGAILLGVDTPSVDLFDSED